MYTELVLNLSLYPNAPPAALDVLRAMTKGQEPVPDRDHPFFKTERWSWMLRCSSHYFVPESYAKLITQNYCDSVHLSVRCALKNYSGEIQEFLEWLAPIAEDGFAGYYRYEEDDHPTLVYFEKGAVKVRELKS